MIGATRKECQLAYDTLFQLLIDLGFTHSEHKLVPPTQRLTFLGVELDTMAGTMTLPADKLAELHTIVLEFQNKQRESKKTAATVSQQIKLGMSCRLWGPYFSPPYS